MFSLIYDLWNLFYKNCVKFDHLQDDVMKLEIYGLLQKLSSNFYTN